jgi:hypothetical protein
LSYVFLFTVTLKDTVNESIDDILTTKQHRQLSLSTLPHPPLTVSKDNSQMIQVSTIIATGQKTVSSLNSSHYHSSAYYGDGEKSSQYHSLTPLSSSHPHLSHQNNQHLQLLTNKKSELLSSPFISNEKTLHSSYKLPPKIPFQYKQFSNQLHQQQLTSQSYQSIPKVDEQQYNEEERINHPERVSQHMEVYEQQQQLQKQQEHQQITKELALSKKKGLFFRKGIEKFGHAIVGSLVRTKIDLCNATNHEVRSSDLFFSLFLTTSSFLLGYNLFR